jgi:hypothetical protein
MVVGQTSGQGVAEEHHHHLALEVGQRARLAVEVDERKSLA